MAQDISPNLGLVRGDRNRQSERRVITVLFCDVVDSTALAEQLDPEEWTEIMNEAFGYLTGPIYRYEGTVARLMGDAILAFFGAPFAHEDDPQRAILAGLDIINGIESFREEIKAEYGLNFNVRVGINTGAVVVGDVGSAQAGEYTAMGDAVNLAARMEQTAAPGTVQIAEDTYGLVAPLFDFEALGGIEVKGKSEPVEAYRVLAPKDEPGRLRGIEGFSAPLVGRSREMDVLRQAITELREGRGQIVCLIGEAGLGKTRLIDELRAEWERVVDEESYTDSSWLESRGISYESNRPYGLFLDRLRKFLDFGESDSPGNIHEKIVEGTENLPSDQRARVIAALDTLFATGRLDETQVDGEALKRELFDSLHHAWVDIASEAPRVRVFDDMHWADPASVELLIHMFHIAEESPFLFICSFRPERQSPAWKIKQTAETDYPHRYTEITLNPLNVYDSDTLVDNLLDSSGVPNQVHQLVQRKAEGNPFFVEEIVRSLIDGGVFTRDEDSLHLHSRGDIRDFTIPDNLQALLTSRIDRLESEARQTLQLASVIGRSFNYKVLKSISSTPDTLERQLSTLQRMDLIHETSRVPERVYSFNHELSREAAYNSILRRQRRVYHRKVGETIEALFPDKLEENAHRLAYHFDEGRNAERALKYYTMAAYAAACLYAHSEAIANYTHAIDLTDRVEVDNEQLILMYTRLGRALELSGDYSGALKRYQALETLARHRNDSALELAALMPQATIRSTYNDQFDPEQGQSLSIRSLALARNLNDPHAQAKVLWNLMLLEVYSGRDSQRAITFGEQSIAISRQHGLKEQLAYSLNDIARAYSQVGRRGDGRAALQESIELWRELDDLPMLSDALLSYANDYNDTGEFDKAAVLAEEALEISRRSDNFWGQALGKFTMSIICIERGELGTGRAAFEDAVPLAEQGNFAGAGTIVQAFAGWIFGIFVGDLDRGLQMTWNALSACEDRPHYRPFVLAVLAHLRLFTEGPSEASKLMNEAREDAEIVGMDLESGFLNMFMVFYKAIDSEIAIANHEYEYALETAESTLSSMKRLGTSLHMPDILRLKGQALMGLERLDEARDTLMEASAIAEAQISRRSIWRILYALSQLEAMLGNLEQAEIYRVQAKEIVLFISENAGSTEGRAFFLNFPLVREVMSVE